VDLREMTTTVKMRDGQMVIIGGLISKNQTASKQKIFLLSDLPLLGPLLSQNDDDKQRSEVMLAITPRIVRHVTVPPTNVMSFDTGKEDDPSLVRPMASFDQEPQFEAVPRGAAKQPPVVPPPPVPVLPQAAPAPLPAVSAPSPPVLAPPPAAPTAENPSSAASPAPSLPSSSPAGAAPAAASQAPPPVMAEPRRGLLQISTPPTIAVGQQFSAEVRVADAGDLGAASAVLTYDPALVEFVAAVEGSFLNRDGKPTQFSSKVDAAGSVTVNAVRGAGTGGVSGNGHLFSARFRAKQQGTAGFGFRTANFSAADGKPLVMLPFSTAVVIK